MRDVPFFNYPFLFSSHEHEILSIVRDVGHRGAYIMQKDLAEFEVNLAKYTGAKYAIGVGNATDAMEMFLSAAGIGKGDEVIICSHTMIATASAVHAVGAKPIPVDAGWDHLINPDSVRAALTDRTKAIMPTQLNGRTCNMDELAEIARENGLMIFEDSAQALGSKFKGRAAGTFGVAGCISFYPAKILGCFGDGGAILCQDAALHGLLLQLRDHGRAPDGSVYVWGRNSRLDNLQAAILSYFLAQYQKVIDRRRAMAQIYTDRLSHITKLCLPPAPSDDDDHFDVYQNYEIEADCRDDLKTYLADRGVGTLVQWGGRAIHHFTALGFQQRLSATDSLFERLLMLPMNMSLRDEDVHFVCDQIESFYGAR